MHNAVTHGREFADLQPLHCLVDRPGRVGRVDVAFSFWSLPACCTETLEPGSPMRSMEPVKSAFDTAPSTSNRANFKLDEPPLRTKMRRMAGALEKVRGRELPEAEARRS